MELEREQLRKQLLASSQHKWWSAVCRDASLLLKIKARPWSSMHNLRSLQCHVYAYCKNCACLCTCLAWNVCFRTAQGFSWLPVLVPTRLDVLPRCSSILQLFGWVSGLFLCQKSGFSHQFSAVSNGILRAKWIVFHGEYSGIHLCVWPASGSKFRSELVIV